MNVDSKTKIDKLMNVLDISKMLNTTAKTEDILHALLQKSISLVDAADMGALFIFNEENNVLEMKSHIGFSKGIENIKICPGESMTGSAFKSKKIIFFDGNESVFNTMKTMSKENTKILLSATSRDLRKLQGSICCPLIHKEESIGVLVIDSFNQEVPLSKEDVEIIEALSVQATTAIINSMALESEKKNRLELRRYNQIIKEQRNRYRHSANIHNHFSDMVLNGCSMGDIVENIAQIVDMDVFIIDLFYNIKKECINNYTSKKEVLNNISNMIPMLSTEKNGEYYDEERSMYFNFSPIIINKNPIGWLVAVSNRKDISEMEDITLQRGRVVLALESMRVTELDDMEQSHKGDFLDSLVLNRDEDYIKKNALKFDYDFSKKHKIVVVAADTYEEKFGKYLSNKEMKMLVKNIYEKLNVEFIKNKIKIIQLIKGKKIYGIIEMNNNYSDEKVNLILDKILNKDDVSFFTQYGSRQMRAGVSDEIVCADDYKEAYTQALESVKLAKINDKKYICFESMYVKKFLMANDEKDLRAFTKKILKDLIRDDFNDKSELLKTLKTYVYSGGNWTITKDALHIHGNTLTYRLNRIKDILDLDLSLYRDRLNIQLALEITEILQLGPQL